MRLQESHTNNKTAEAEIITKAPQYYHHLNTKMTIPLCCRDYSSAQEEKVPKTFTTKQRVRCKHEEMCHFHLTKVGERMPSTEINCLRQQVKIHGQTKPSEGQTWILWSFKSSGFSFWALMHPLKARWELGRTLPCRGCALGWQLSPAPTECGKHQEPQEKLLQGPGRSWGTWWGCSRWRRTWHSIPGSGNVERLLPGAAPTGGQSHPPPKDKELLSLTWALLLLLSHPANTLATTKPHGFVSLLTCYQLAAHSTHSLLQNCQELGFVPFKHLSKAL